MAATPEPEQPPLPPARSAWLVPSLLAVLLAAAAVSAFALSTAARLLLFILSAGSVAALGALLRADRLRGRRREAELLSRSAALSERVKEQRSLYAVSAILGRDDLTLHEALSRVVGEIPAGWQWPHRTIARLEVDGRTHASGEAAAGSVAEHREIPGTAGVAGRLEVAVDPGPEGAPDFLPEELALLDALADRIGERYRRREAEVQLERSEAHFRSLVEHVQDIILILDPAGKNLYVSPSMTTLLGRDPGERVGSDVLDNVHSADRERVREHLLAADGEPVEFRVRHVDERWRLMEAVGTPFSSGAGPRDILVVARDITERRELEERLQGAQRLQAIGRLAGGVAHDFNNILTGLQGLTHLTLDALPPDVPEDVRDNLRQMDSATRRAADLVRQLLAFSRQQILQPRTMELSDVVRGVDGLLDRLVGNDVEFRLELAPEGTLVRVDPGQMEHVLVNLAANARDAMAAGGRLTVSTGPLSLSPDAVGTFDFPVEPGEYALLTVTDTGEGMSQAVLDHVFDPFYTTRPPGQGAGLGLSTVYGIVKQSGGFIWAESAPGRGSTFRVAFPRVRPEPGNGSPPATAPGHPGGTVLVAEDDEAVRALVRRVLARAGYRVLEAAHGEEALVVLAGETVHLLLTDLVMPVMGGRELVAQARARIPELPVLVMSGYAEDPELREELASSTGAFLPKPFTPAALLDAVRRGMRNSL